MNRNEKLSIPDVVSTSDRAMELARLWIADGKPTFVINGNLWDEPATWGVLLADFTRHISTAYDEQGQSKSLVLNQIIEAFNIELNNPTDERSPTRAC